MQLYLKQFIGLQVVYFRIEGFCFVFSFYNFFNVQVRLDLVWSCSLVMIREEFYLCAEMNCDWLSVNSFLIFLSFTVLFWSCFCSAGISSFWSSCAVACHYCYYVTWLCICLVAASVCIRALTKLSCLLALGRIPLPWQEPTLKHYLRVYRGRWFPSRAKGPALVVIIHLLLALIINMINFYILHYKKYYICSNTWQ